MGKDIGDMRETRAADWPDVNLLHGFGFTTRSYITKVFNEHGEYSVIVPKLCS